MEPVNNDRGTKNEDQLYNDLEEITINNINTAASIAFNDTFTLQSLFFQKFYLFCESSNSFLIFKTKASFKFSKIPKFKDK